MNELLTQLVLVAGLSMGLFTCAWTLLARRRQWELVDSLWALSLGAVALGLSITGEGDLWRRLIMATLMVTWSWRLGHHLFFGRWRNGIEDGRYRHWTRTLGSREHAWMFGFFQIQALSVAALALPLIIVAGDDRPLDGADAIGVVVFLVALIGESLADKTLNRFRLDPANRGRVCREGLWAWSRHPNYFFEWIHWFSYPLLAGFSAGAWAGPLVMGWLLTRVSGIPLTEAQALRSRGQAYRNYQKTTSAFFPRPPKQGSSS